MAMQAGDNTVQAGTLARELYDSFNSLFGAVTGGADDTRREICAEMAVIVTYIQNNAEVVGENIS